MGTADYTRTIAQKLGWRRVGYQPETRWPTSGTKAWKTELPFSGALDRMRSGTQKVSAWQGIGAYTTNRTTGVMMTGRVNPTPNQMVTYRTARALKVSNPWTYDQMGPGTGQVQSDTYYAEAYAAGKGPQISTARRIWKAMMGG